MSHESIQTMISLDAITPSPTNPRKDFPPDMLAALAENILLHGVLQPVLVRFDKADATRYELVCGERRYRAARTAGLKQIPAMVRELTDEQVIEVQLVENLQREGLSPIEEAEGYERLQKECGLTADQIAEKIGQSRSYVFGRLKLLDLEPAPRRALRDGKLNASTALLIARIPVKALQDRACKEITSPDYRGEGMTYRRAAEHVQRHYMLRLSTARFPTDDAELVATAGACQKCPKRTGNQMAIFDDVDSADVCTDPECFAAKGTAHKNRLIAEAKAADQKVIEGKKAMEIRPSQYSSDLAGGFVSLDQKFYLGKHGEEVRTLKEILGDDAPTPALLVDPHDQTKLTPILAKAAVKDHLKAKGIQLPGLTASSESSQRDKEQTAKQDKARDYRTRLFDECRSVLTLKPPVVPQELEEDIRLLADHMLSRAGFDDQKRITRYWIGPKEKGQDEHALIQELIDRTATLSGAECVRLMLELTAIGALHVPTYLNDYSTTPDSLAQLALRCGIDEEALKLKIAAEAKAAREGAKKAAPKQGKKPTPAADKTAPHPRKAPRGGEVDGADKAKPTPKAKAAPKKAPGKGKDQAPAKPAEKPTPSAGTKTLAPKYRNPANADQTWSGVGKKPSWVAEALASGKTLAELEVGSSQAPAKPAKGGKTITVPPMSPVSAWPFPASSAA